MPCRDYESDYDSRVSLSVEYDRVKERCDMLARISCTIMQELEYLPEGVPSSVALRRFLDNREIRDWWGKHKLEDMKALETKKKTFRKQVLSAINSAGNAEFVEEELRNILKEKTND